MIEILTSLEASIDFTDEDMSSKASPNLSQDVEDVLVLITDILSTYKEGKLSGTA